VTPFLFLLVVDSLVELFRQAIKRNLFCGVRVGEKETEVGLLQFVDVTLFLGDVSPENIWVIKVLSWYQDLG